MKRGSRLYMKKSTELQFRRMDATCTNLLLSPMTMTEDWAIDSPNTTVTKHDFKERTRAIKRADLLSW
jgi:hypothetical protein